MKAIRYVGTGNNLKGSFTYGKIYPVLDTFKHTLDFVITEDDHGDYVDAYLPNFEIVEDISHA